MSQYSYIKKITKDNKNKNLVLEAINKSEVIQDLFAVMDASLCDDIEIMLEAVKKDGLLLRFAGLGIAKNKELIESAIIENERAIQYVDYEIKSEKELHEKLILNNPIVVTVLENEFKSNREIIIKSLRKAIDETRIIFILSLSYFYKSLPEKFRDDNEIYNLILPFSEAIHSYQYCSDRLKKDKDILISLINLCVIDKEIDEVIKNTAKQNLEDIEIIKVLIMSPYKALVLKIIPSIVIKDTEKLLDIFYMMDKEMCLSDSNQSISKYDIGYNKVLENEDVKKIIKKAMHNKSNKKESSDSYKMSLRDIYLELESVKIKEKIVSKLLKNKSMKF